MASISSSTGGQDASATELDANLKAAAFPELQRKCTELKIDFEPSIDSELAHIERRKDVNKRWLCWESSDVVVSQTHGWLLLLFCLLDVVVLHARFPEG